MADQTSAELRMSRSDLAAYLRDLAGEFEGEGEVEVVVDNKNVTVSPPAEIDCEIAVEERSAMLTGDAESLSIDLEWSPAE